MPRVVVILPASFDNDLEHWTFKRRRLSTPKKSVPTKTKTRRVTTATKNKRRGRGATRRGGPTKPRRYRRWSGPCAYCGAKGRLTVDHVVPLCDGGSYANTNVALVCSTCNQDKADLSLIFWHSRLYRSGDRRALQVLMFHRNLKVWEVRQPHNNYSLQPCIHSEASLTEYHRL